MKRFALVLLGASLLTACGGGGVRSVRDSDSLERPQTLKVGQSVSGTVAGQDRDFDYYSFEAKKDDKLKLVVQTKSANASSTLDPYVWIIMPDKFTELERASGADGGQDTEFRFNAPETGTYYIKITSFAIRNDIEATDNKASNTYRLTLSKRE